MKDKAKLLFNAVKPVCAIVLILCASVSLILLSSYTSSFEEATTEIVTHQTRTEYDDTKRDGTSEIRQEGYNGNKTVIYEVTKNIFGREVNRVRVSEIVNKEPKDKIVVIGTKRYYTCSNGTEYDNKDARDECDKRVAWEKGRDQALKECKADSSKTNCWYDEYPGTYIHWTEPRTYTYTPAPGPSSGYRSGAICRDGWRSSAPGRGACSHHGGVAYWI